MKPHQIRKLLVANRSETAIRIFRAGTVTEVLVEPGTEIEAKDLLVVVDIDDTADGLP